MDEFFAWINANGQTLGVVLPILIALGSSVVAFIRYLNLRSKELQSERFKIYHGLVRDLVQPDSAGTAMSMDRQIAIVFELRHFDEYFELTLRMLEGLRTSWVDPRLDRLTREIALTIEYITGHSKLKGANQPDA